MVPPADGPAGHRQSDGAMRRSQVVRQRILMPLYERLKANLLASAKLAVDETPVPVLDPGRGQTKTRTYLKIPDCCRSAINEE